MNFQQIKFVITVVQTNSFSEAAAICCVTQPTLSNAIAKLEQELGGKLFERNTRKVSLSGLGLHVLPIIQAIADSKKELANSATAYLNPDHKLLRIGLSPLVNAQLVKLITEPFLLKNPDVELFFKQCEIDNMAQRLRDQQVDLLIRPTPINASKQKLLTQTSLYKDQLVYLPQELHRKNSGAVKLKDIKDDIFILSVGICGLREVTLDMFESRGYSINQYSGQALGYEVLLEWAQLGIGSAILPSSKVSSDYADKSHTLILEDDKPAQVEFVAIWQNNLPAPTHIKQFQKHLLNNGKQLINGLDR